MNTKFKILIFQRAQWRSGLLVILHNKSNDATSLVLLPILVYYTYYMNCSRFKLINDLLLRRVN